jgi:hypothetical protein
MWIVESSQMKGMRTGQLDRHISIVGFATAATCGAILGGMGGPGTAALGALFAFVAAIVLWVPFLMVWNAAYSILGVRIGLMAAAVFVSSVLAGIVPLLILFGFKLMSSNGNLGGWLAVTRFGSWLGLMPAILAGGLTFLLLRNGQQEEEV